MGLLDIKFKSELQGYLRKWAKARGLDYHTKIYAEINGKSMYLNEYEVRFLQLMCNEYCDTDEKFKEWCNTFVLYDGRFKKKSIPLEWQRDGRFKEKPQSGFLDTAGTIHMCLLKRWRDSNS